MSRVLGSSSGYMANLGSEHWSTVKRILRYIKETPNVALCYGGSDFISTGYVDSNFAGDLDKRKSTTSFVFTLANGAEAVWIQRLLEKLGHKQECITLFYDSQSALHIARNPAFHSRTKHIGVQYHFIREVVEDGIVDMKKNHTKDNLADALTKSINTIKFEWCRSSYDLAET
ncbi:hypothetical protein LIER_12080 [Lithospermum erythrorhizon]|uniref:Retrovirus-related Pol polyprotein from transposon TNT 1-94 n=1 Tax=Lithospermum erythrorhizon TaxID=34254 RepID=A0AAV3PQI9_LITER